MTVVASQFEYVVGLLAKQVYTLAVSMPLGSLVSFEECCPTTHEHNEPGHLSSCMV